MLFLLAFLDNVHTACSAISCLSAIAAFTITILNFFVISDSDHREPTKAETALQKSVKRTIKTLWIVFFVSFPLGLVPSADNLWKMRIALIKLELARPENVSAGVDRISEIADKLECKYLGCPKSGKHEESHEED